MIDCLNAIINFKWVCKSTGCPVDCHEVAAGKPMPDIDVNCGYRAFTPDATPDTWLFYKTVWGNVLNVFIKFVNEKILNMKFTL
jgi:hypothetical protein